MIIILFNVYILYIEFSRLILFSIKYKIKNIKFDLIKMKLNNMIALTKIDINSILKNDIYPHLTLNKIIYSYLHALININLAKLTKLLLNPVFLKNLF